jgi:two-component sensor histidine kinase
MLVAELKASHAREGDLIRDRDQLLERQTLLTREFEHRLVNGLQIVASLLSMQGRAATTPEAAVQLNDASIRVAAIGRVHHRLHLLDKEERVDFRRYVQELCDDLSALLLHDPEKRKIIVSGTDGFLPVATGIPLGFIVSELVTNSAKYTKGDIQVHVADESAGHSLTITDEGFGLPDGFDPANSKGLGMNIVRSLVKQIGGTLEFSPGQNGSGTSVKVAFASIA